VRPADCIIRLNITPAPQSKNKQITWHFAVTDKLQDMFAF
jgi:hypothetical protein